MPPLLTGSEHTESRSPPRAKFPHDGASPLGIGPHGSRPAAPRMALRLPTPIADSHLIKRAQARSSCFRVCKNTEERDVN